MEAEILTVTRGSLTASVEMWPDQKACVTVTHVDEGQLVTVCVGGWLWRMFGRDFVTGVVNAVNSALVTANHLLLAKQQFQRQIADIKTTLGVE